MNETWELNRLGREYYPVTITTNPALTDWEISFNHGETWHDLAWNATDEHYRILVAGPNFVVPDGDNAIFVRLTMSVVPYIRAIDVPEVIIRTTPKIELV